tara:strand:- start:894 stop:1205 length:312 start_codon:yes stop_codon:yes gene_type:complete
MVDDSKNGSPDDRYCCCTHHAAGMTTTAIEPDQIRSLDSFDDALMAIVDSAAVHGVPHSIIVARTLRRITQTLAAEYGAAHAAMVLRYAARVIETDQTLQGRV